MKPRKQFATREQRAAWQAECEREATRRLLRRLLKQLRQLAVQPVPKDQYLLATEYRRARAAHVKALLREREDVATGRHLADDHQMNLALVN